ncbi:cytochrome b [Vibrio sp. SCSIO 43136]|uniref:cytochrome b n=1 Tax=Vibrio sp. SCSIO 43136 TaxID=2819101 RepID=UPI002075F898|nr:cytochrome b [Vibrio sp. SCSIO 43136]USD67183.1 cytochrome b [Vibrio sp. SCSIO 43136]
MGKEVKRLSIPTIAAHWIVASFMIGLLGLGLYMEDLERSPFKFELYGIHKSLGTIALLFISLRLLWRLKEGALPSVGNMPRWQEVSAKAMHHLLLLMTFVMPISGIIMNRGGGRALEVFGVEVIAGGEKIEWMQQVGGAAHEFGTNALIALLVLHVLAAIKHEFVDKDGTIKRMVGKSQ